MTDLVSWTRFEPVTRDPSLQDGLAAAIADPLWLLARQDALGEFAATDAGSPVVTRLRAQASLLTRLRPGSDGTGPGIVFTPGAGPLETLVEAEPEPDGESRPLFAAQAGLAYLRRLAAAGGATSPHTRPVCCRRTRSRLRPPRVGPRPVSRPRWT